MVCLGLVRSLPTLSLGFFGGIGAMWKPWVLPLPSNGLWSETYGLTVNECGQYPTEALWFMNCGHEKDIRAT